MEGEQERDWSSLIGEQPSAEILEPLEGPWALVEHAATGDKASKQRQMEDWEDLGASEQRVRQEYTGRYPIELLQNAHDACSEKGIRGQVWFRITETALLVANQGQARSPVAAASLG